MAAHGAKHAAHALLGHAGSHRKGSKAMAKKASKSKGTTKSAKSGKRVTGSGSGKRR